MKGFLKKSRMVIPIVLLIGAMILSTTEGAHSAYLEWGAHTIQTGSIKTGFSFANDAMRHLSFSNIRKSPSQVVGSRSGCDAIITIIGTTPRVTAVIMVIGDNQSATIKARDELLYRIQRIVQID